MCGIAVILSPQKTATDSAIRQMTACIEHRGPDADGFYQDNGTLLGHRRLSIIDLGGGAQPMADHTERYWITFNGEIYNYRQLRADLEAAGHKFRTTSDTEVLLYAYIQYGDACPEKLNGQYAFAVWDRNEKKLFAARDRMGEKPLYWTQTPDGNLLVASEIKALLGSRLVEPKIDPIAIELYLTLLYIPPDRTVYSNIHTLLPAHAMSWQNGKMRQWSYWEPKYGKTTKIDAVAAGEEVKRLVDQAVHRQMVADVPIGAFLSGGLDSSTIVACMTQHSTLPVKTFSAGFGDLIDELPYARAVAEQYKTEHHELQMTMPLGDLLDRMVKVYDEPFADSSNVPTYCICEFARKHVKVALSGDGGDELFGGYHWNAPRLRDLEWRKNPPSLAWAAINAFRWRVLAKLSGRFGKQRHHAVTHYNDVAAVARKEDLWLTHLRGQCFFDVSERRQLLGGKGAVDVATIMREHFYPDSAAVDMDRVTDFDLRSYLPGDILVKVDRASMALSLENRAPFLDVDLVEFMVGLPWQMRFEGSKSKPLLHRAYDHAWPPQLRTRSKQGFGAPVLHWMEKPEIKSRYEKAIRAGGPLTQMLPGTRGLSDRLRPYQKWSLMCLGMWLDAHT